MFDWYTNIKHYFEKGYWTLEQVKMAVVKNKITKEQFKEITGEDYLQDVTEPSEVVEK